MVIHYTCATKSLSYETKLDYDSSKGKQDLKSYFVRLGTKMDDRCVCPLPMYLEANGQNTFQHPFFPLQLIVKYYKCLEN